jgi:hypothetical protein
MKKLMLLVVTFTLMSTGTPAANAVTDGCPDTWKIDTSSIAGFQELQQAKARIGSDLALSEPVVQYSNYAGELGAMAAPKDRNELGIEDVYLYGKTQVQWKIEVQLKNCANKTTFLINRGSLLEHLGFKNLVANVDPQTWASANEQNFIDFTKAAQFGSCIKSVQSIFSPPNLNAQLRGSLLIIGALGGLVRQRTYNDPCGLFRVNPMKNFVYQDLSPECRYFSEEMGRSTAIRKNGSCDVALALPTRESLIVFTKFTLKAKDYEVKVTCVKGKLTKSFTTYRGYEFSVKCPAGYKKK